MTCYDLVATGRYPYTGRLGILSRADEAEVEFLERCAPGRWLVTAIAFVGGYTFEIFITHCYALRGSVWHYLLFAAIYAAVLHLASLAVKKAGELIGRLLRPVRETAS